MNNAFIVIREQKNIDDKFWVCNEVHDALRIAQDVTDYWKKEYQPVIDAGEFDETLYSDLVFHFDCLECFRVSVQPQVIRNKGEYKQIDA